MLAKTPHQEAVRHPPYRNADYEQIISLSDIFISPLEDM